MTLELVPNGQANVGVDFNGDSYENVTTFAGTAGQLGYADGVGAAATFTRPQRLTFGGGTVYVADAHANVIRAIDVATAAVTTLAGNASAPAGSADGTGAAASFSEPIGVAYDAGTQAVYVTDVGNCTVRTITVPAGVVTTLAGQPGVCAAADGTGSAATSTSFTRTPSSPTASGNLLLSDAGTPPPFARSRSPRASVTTIAGATNQPGTVDGPAATARFGGPGALAFDGTNLYVLDGSTLRTLAPRATPPVRS